MTFTTASGATVSAWTEAKSNARHQFVVSVKRDGFVNVTRFWDHQADDAARFIHKEQQS
jgi:hypothetical protein